MSEVNYIEKNQLPLELDFLALKEKALAYIQEHSSNAWTNLNTSDPGITILEQLCYAFTELGYCNNFPIKDILTQKNNKLQVTNQFYLPQNILTTSPITIEDYNTYLIDRLDAVKNTITTVFQSKLSQVKGAYRSYLLLDNYTLNEETKTNICKSAFYELNNVRNLGEFFFQPNYLIQEKYNVNANLEIDQGYDLSEVLKEIQYQINNYVFPDVTQTGYTNLKENGLTTNEIFNGPILKNGWISSASIQTKKDTIKSFEIIKVIESIPGVKSITNLIFESGDLVTQQIPSSGKQIIYLDFITPAVNKSSNITSQGKYKAATINTDYIDSLIEMQQPKNQVDAVAAVKMAPDVPEGKYRDITSYYSIQNTFPESYAVGLNAVNNNTPTFQVAQSRQLKGYLTLFDQALTNQFAQLANLGSLFSFKNSTTGTPADLEEFLNKKTKWQKMHEEYPAPFEDFSPTYYYQSLYESVPNIEVLLKNYEAYRFSYSTKTPEDLAKSGWIDYKSSPYNTYIWGLMYYMENEEVNLNRRNEILNHLLARHGESHLVIETIINSPVYTINLIKDQVIIKSVYLQNIQILSYNRDKAYNYLGADTLKKELTTVYKLLLQKLQILNNSTFSVIIEEEEKTKIDNEAKAEKLLNNFTHASQSDFIVDVDRIDEREKVTNIDLINYAAIELKLSLLFALNECYQNYIVDHPVEELLWMITRRKGLLFIETSLLIKSATFQLIEGDSFSINPPKDVINLSYEDLILSFQKTAEEQKYDINVDWNGQGIKPLNDPLLSYTFLLVFPEFLNSTEFQNRLDFFLENELPPQLNYKYLFIDPSNLKELIPKYTKWHNDLIFGSEETALISSSWSLLEKLEDTYNHQQLTNG
jgi:hypothetical protein